MKHTIFLLLITILPIQNIFADDLRDIYDETISLLEMRWLFKKQNDEVSEVNENYASLKGQTKFNQGIEKLKNRFSQSSKDKGNRVMFEELHRFFKRHEIYKDKCKGYEWRFIHEWNFYEYIDNVIFVARDGIKKQVSDYTFMFNALENLSVIFEELNIKALISYKDEIFPPLRMVQSHINALEENFSSALKSRLYEIEYNYKCDKCSEGAPIDSLISYFDKKVKPQIDEYLKTLMILKERAEDTAYLMPRKYKEPCMEAVMYNVAGMNLSPEDILKLGEAELKKADDEMLRVMREYLKEKDLSLDEMNTYLREMSSEQIDYVDAEDYLSELDDIINRSINFSKKVTSKKTSKPKLEDLNREASSFAESWRDCTIIVNSQAPSMRNTLPALMIHEGIPGHHLDLCKDGTLEDKKVNQLRLHKHLYNTDRIEGWAFYMEEVADDFGFYKGALERIGYLEMTRTRALRLILTYQYYFGDWSEEQAREYHLAHAVVTETELNSEIGRARQWSGQVLNYMIGKESIKKMRKKSREKLGEKFDIIKFHDYILQNSKVSLATIKLGLDDWIQSQK